MLAVMCIGLAGCTGEKDAKHEARISSVSGRETAAAQADDASWSGRVPDAGALLMLVPDGQNTGTPEVTAWVDAASEEGIRLLPVTNRQFSALGPNALGFAGLVLPDQIHTQASDTMVQAVRDYVTAGGQAMLVYDFGVYTLDSNQKPTYPIPKSRLSDLAGVDYVLYDALREKSTVVGQVTAMRSTLRELQVPPGKSMAYQTEASRPSDPATANAVPVAATSQSEAPNPTPSTAGVPAEAARPTDQTYQPVSQVAAPRGAASTVGTPRKPASADRLETYSGYLLGALKYSSFVTKGAFKGQVLATSPVGGLVAGLHQVGKGQVLFVNLPLTYLKVARSDALPMHGFLHYFAHTTLAMARLSPVPNAVPGLTLNWHLDSATAQLPSMTLEKLGVFKHGPFSVHLTAGPDAVVDGDRKGWNLDNNPDAQALLRRLSDGGHAIGSHGGWNHDYYGLQANETNRDVFLPYLRQNAEAIRRAVSHPLRPYFGLKTATPAGMPPTLLPIVQRAKTAVDWALGPPLREYSPPVGNNPLWAMDWLEQQDVVGAYFVGHTGLGPTRQYRDGQLRNPAMWVFPVTPQGLYATFEEFETQGVPPAEVAAWYRDSVDFVQANDTSRMVYMHPNGATAKEWPAVLQNLLDHARAQGEDQFKWYTMVRLADFMTTRSAAQWTERRTAAGVSQFELSHPSSLSEMVWLLPKRRYPDKPLSPDGSVTVSERGANWAVRAGNTRQARFSARAV